MESELAAVTIFRVRAEITKFAASGPIAVCAVFAIHGQRAEHAVFIPITAKNEVAIFIEDAGIAVIAIDGADIHERHARHIALQIRVLLKKPAVEIKRPAVRERIPFVRKPRFSFIDFVWRVLRIHGNNVRACEIALSAVEKSVIAERESPLVLVRKTNGERLKAEFRVCVDIGLR